MARPDQPLVEHRLDAAPASGLRGLLGACRGLEAWGCLDLGPQTTVVTWRLPGGATTVWRVEDGGDWRAAIRPGLRGGRSSGLPFRGGLMGWIGYEAGVVCERMPAPRSPRLLPDVALWRCDGAVVIDHRTDAWTVVGTPGFADDAAARIAAGSGVEGPPPTTRAPEAPPSGLPWRAPQDARYRQGVRDALDDIRAGRMYQVNLAWAAEGTAPEDPVGRWLTLRQQNPARRGALLRGPDQDGAPTWLLSNSPELYLQLGPRGSVRSTPIKGTARRGPGQAGARTELRDSDKERAELTMIADLVRNDLGRVARPGSVRAAPRRIGACGDLWHASQSVSARLAPGSDVVDLLTATFPPGSVTGAPKVAAMARIGATETTPRGVYTGCYGLFGDDGSASLAVAIRVAQIHGTRALVHVGAGIVADSDPDAEWAETLAKGRVLAHHALAAP